MIRCNWNNVRLLFFREVRDQLRDRRTLFMIAVLPLLLYPLLGMSLFQVAQFVREQPTRVLLIGADHLPAEPALVDGERFAARLFSETDKAQFLEVHRAEDLNDEHELKGLHASEPDAQQAAARRAVEAGLFEAVVYVPADFKQQLARFRASLEAAAAARSAAPLDAEVPSPAVFYSTAKEKSQLAYLRVTQVLRHWTEEIGQENLVSSRVPPSAVNPFKVEEHDVAEEEQRHAAMWSKILPFMLLIWALTGAFYPAIDLCAGEKERGTLETLLSSPAERDEIVWGKLLTVMTFSVMTAALNVVSLGFTGLLVVRQFPELGPPPPLAPVWLAIALLPMSALFSALCLALAALARSTKEGQYYLMPLVLVTLPLVMLPMAPGVELTLGNSLIPVTGVVLLLRTMLEGDYLQASLYVGPVIAVTLACCLFAVRWAVDQFNSEAVLFRESERLDLTAWMRHLVRDRGDTPSAAEAVLCGVVILMLNFFLSLALGESREGKDLVTLALVTQLAVVATPALLMTVMLTRSPRKTLLLRWPAWASLPAAALLAAALHPAVSCLNVIVQRLYPISASLEKELHKLLAQAPDMTTLILALGVAPAIFEELAFRGFVLSGFRHLGHKWRAIVLSSLFFGVSHGVFQQSVVASLVGVVIGYLAVQSGSILPGMLFHVTHNSLALLSTQVTPALRENHPRLAWLLMDPRSEGFPYSPVAVGFGVLLAALVLFWFRSLPYRRTDEELLQEALEQQTSHPALG
ncbi:MAG: CPBP family intramembrane metalloprotease [Planctomycetes bacterium]|nr:CPBP family intramembrane metalloprotease [Planctomycetota bacterium]